MAMTDNPQYTYLVTGGAGFIGTNFVKYLLGEHGKNVRVIVLDALTYAGNAANLRDEIDRGDIVFIHGDINDRALVEKIFSEYDPDFVVNFAAESHVDRSIENPRIFAETNILGTQTLLDAAKKFWRNDDGTWRPVKRFLQISTDEVYGSLTRDYDEPRPIAISEDVHAIVAERGDTPSAYGEGFFRETTPLSPRSPYSAAKAAADMMVMAYRHTYGMPVNITRCSNNYGPWQFPEKLIPLLINNILAGRPLPVYGRGINVRDWLYVDDHCSAIDTVLRRGTAGEIYNIGGFNEKQNIDIVREVIDIVAELTGTAPRHDLVTYVRDRAGHDLRYAIDPEKIATQLGWYPRTTFARGIRKTVEWYLGHRDWMDSVTSGEYLNYYRQMYDNR